MDHYLVIPSCEADCSTAVNQLRPELSIHGTHRRATGSAVAATVYACTQLTIYQI